MIEHFDGIGKQFDNTAFKRGAEAMLKDGFAFDYISDKQIDKLVMESGHLVTEGKSQYRTIVIPRGEYIPLKTFQKIISLADAGATVITLEGLPASFSGYARYEENKKTFETILSKLKSGKNVSPGVSETRIGEGRILSGDSLDVLLHYASIRRETLNE